MAGSHDKTKRAAFSDWLVESLRVTVFTNPEGFALENSHWKELFEHPAESRIVNSKKLLINEEGPFESAILKVGSNPTRIDWLLEYKPDIDKEGELPRFGSLENALNSFVKLMMEWLPASRQSTRLAFGAILLLPASNREDGYRTLAPYLESMKLDPGGSSDFSYQINRPRKSSSLDIPNFTINRLTRWSVSSFTPMQIELSPEKISTFKAKEEYFCRLELDISTLAKFKNELPKQKMAALFEELVNLGREIVREGDIA